MAIIAPESIIEGITAHIAAGLGVDMARIIAEELLGIQQVAQLSFDYFSSNVQGAPVSSDGALLWAIISGIYADKIPQEEIDKFFSNVRLSVPKLIMAYNAMTKDSASDTRSDVSVALIPGKLTEVDIATVAEALFMQSTGYKGD